MNYTFRILTTAKVKYLTFHKIGIKCILKDFTSEVIILEN